MNKLPEKFLMERKRLTRLFSAIAAVEGKTYKQLAEEWGIDPERRNRGREFKPEEMEVIKEKASSNKQYKYLLKIIKEQEE